MALKLSVFTTSTRPIQRGDLWREPLACYSNLADELIVIDGGNEVGGSSLDGSIDIVAAHWPTEFDWPLIGNMFQRGYEACTGDWVIHADLDFIFHEQNWIDIRRACERHNQAPALSFWKYQFILPDRYNLKSRLVLAVNKGKYGDRIRFDSGGDLCQPSLDGNYLSPNDVPEAEIPFFNYEKILKTKDQLAEDCGRMERAWQRHFGTYQMGSDGSNESAYEAYINLMRGRFSKPSRQVGLDFHPQIMHNTIKELMPENFGYDAHGWLEPNNYTKGLA